MATIVDPQPTQDAAAFSRATHTSAKLLRSYLSDAFWAARVTAGVVILIGGRTWPAFRHELSFLVPLAILTYPVRSVRWGTIYNFFLAGFLFAFAIVGAQYLVEKALLGGQYPAFGSAVVAPLTEEIGKILPLVVLLLIGASGFRNSYGACDLMLCGAGLGSGFGLFEDSARLTQTFPTPTGPALLGVPVFPDSYGGFLGHGASTAFIGLTLGFLFYAIRWQRTVLVGWCSVLIVAFWMMVDHAVSNFSKFSEFRDFPFLPIRWLWKLDDGGSLSPYIFLGLMLATIAAERLLLWHLMRGYPRLPATACCSYIRRPLKQGFGYPQFRAIVLRTQALLQYVLAYRRLIFLVAHWKGDLASDRSSFGPLIALYAGKVKISQIAMRRP